MVGIVGYISVAITRDVNETLCRGKDYFWTQKAGPKNATLVVVVVVVVVVISSVKIPKAFLIRSGAQRNFANTFVLSLPTDLKSQVFHLFSN